MKKDNMEEKIGER